MWCRRIKIIRLNSKTKRSASDNNIIDITVRRSARRHIIILTIATPRRAAGLWCAVSIYKRVYFVLYISVAGFYYRTRNSATHVGRWHFTDIFLTFLAVRSEYYTVPIIIAVVIDHILSLLQILQWYRSRKIAFALSTHNRILWWIKYVSHPKFLCHNIF